MTLSRDVIWHMARDSAQLPRLGATRACARLAHDNISENDWQLLQGKKQYDYLGKEERKAMLARVWDDQVSQSSIDELFLGNKSGQAS